MTVLSQDGLTRSDPVRRWGHFANRFLRNVALFLASVQGYINPPCNASRAEGQDVCIDTTAIEIAAIPTPAGVMEVSKSTSNLKIISIAHLLINLNYTFLLALSCFYATVRAKRRCATALRQVTCRYAALSTFLQQ